MTNPVTKKPRDKRNHVTKKPRDKRTSTSFAFSGKWLISFDSLTSACVKLDADEVEVVAMVAARLVKGRKQYGSIGPKLSDPNWDFLKEAEEEDWDWLAYRAAAVVAERRRKNANRGGT